MKNFKNTCLVFIKCFLGFNMILSLAWYSDHKEDIQLLKHQDEFVKVRVLIDSINFYRDSSYGSGSGTGYCQVNYSNPKGRIEFQDDKSAIFKPKEEKSNIVQFLEYSTKHNDSIYVWHHPKLRDRYAKEQQVLLKETFNWYKMISVSILFYMGVLTALYLFVKYLVTKNISK